MNLPTTYVLVRPPSANGTWRHRRHQLEISRFALSSLKFKPLMKCHRCRSLSPAAECKITALCFILVRFALWFAPHRGTLVSEVHPRVVAFAFPRCLIVPKVFVIHFIKRYSRGFAPRVSRTPFGMNNCDKLLLSMFSSFGSHFGSVRTESWYPCL